LGGFVGQLALPLVFSKPLSAIEVAETWNAVRSPYATVTEPAVISTLAGAEEGLSGGGSGGGGGLAEAIQMQGKRLRKAAPVEKKSTPQNSLLDQLKKGKALKKVEAPVMDVSVQKKAANLFGDEVNKILSLRKHLQADSDSDSDCEDWEG
jgi:hypothetical protein